MTSLLVGCFNTSVAMGLIAVGADQWMIWANIAFAVLNFTFVGLYLREARRA